MKIEQFLEKTVQETPELWCRAGGTLENPKGGILPIAKLSKEQFDELCNCDEFSNIKEFHVVTLPNFIVPGTNDPLATIYHKLPNYKEEDRRFIGEKAYLYCCSFNPVPEIVKEEVEEISNYKVQLYPTTFNGTLLPKRKLVVSYSPEFLQDSSLDNKPGIEFLLDEVKRIILENKTTVPVYYPAVIRMNLK